MKKVTHVTLFILRLIIQNSLDLMMLVGGILGIGYILGTVENFSNRQAFRAFGKKGIFVTAWLGTPVHELSHLLMCFVFHHKVDQVKLFQFKADDGTLGYVIHRFNPGSLYQKAGNFFIGIAPIFGGIVAIFGVLYVFVPESFKVCFLIVQQALGHHDIGIPYLVVGAQTIVQMVHTLFTWKNMTHPSFWLFVYVSMCIASHISLSQADIKGAVSGLSSLFVLLLLINGFVTFFHINGLNLTYVFLEWNLYLAGAAGLALLFSLCHLLICYGVLGLRQLFPFRGQSRFEDGRFF
jgi:hypothetical protein